MNDLTQQLSYLKLPYIRQHHENVAQLAARKQWTHVHYLSELIRQEAGLRKDRTIQRRIRMARFPVVKTLDQFNWSWPQKINQAQIQNLFRLKFIEEKSNVVFIGGVGLGNYVKLSIREKPTWHLHWDIRPVLKAIRFCLPLPSIPSTI